MGNNNSYYLVPGSELNTIADVIRDQKGIELQPNEYIGGAVYVDFYDQTNLSGDYTSMSFTTYGQLLSRHTEMRFMRIRFNTNNDVTWDDNINICIYAPIGYIVETQVSETFWHYEIIFTQPLTQIHSGFAQNPYILELNGYSAINEYSLFDFKTEIASISATNIPTYQLLILNATAISQQNIPYVENGSIKWMNGYENMYSYVDSSGAVVLSVPQNAILMIRGDNHTIIHGLEDVSSSMNLDWIGSELHWYKITGDAELSASY